MSANQRDLVEFNRSKRAIAQAIRRQGLATLDEHVDRMAHRLATDLIAGPAWLDGEGGRKVYTLSNEDPTPSKEKTMNNETPILAQLQAATPEEKKKIEATIRRQALRNIGVFVGIKVALHLSIFLLARKARNYANSLDN